MVVVNICGYKFILFEMFCWWGYLFVLVIVIFFVFIYLLIKVMKVSDDLY